MNDSLGVVFRDASGQLHVFTAEAFATESEHVVCGMSGGQRRRDIQRVYPWNQESRIRDNH